MERPKKGNIPVLNDISPWQLREDPQNLLTLYNTMLAVADFGRGTKQQIATLAYQMYNISIMARCRFDVLKGEYSVVVMRYQTRKERERAFLLGHDSGLLGEALSEYARRRKENSAEDCRVVIPYPLFDTGDLSALLGSDWKLKNEPTLVCRAYVDKESFTPFKGTLNDFNLAFIRPQDGEKIQRLYDQNYPNNSFDPMRLSEGNYQGLQKASGKWVSACGVYPTFFVNGFGPVTISCDLVVTKEEREKDLGIFTYSETIQGALTGSLVRQPSQIVIADCINQRSVAMARKLGFHEANWNWWAVYTRK